MLQPPSAYVEGYAKASRHDSAAADNYIRHTTIGDPTLDPVMEELGALPAADLHRFIKAGIEQQDAVLRVAPKALRDFFSDLEEPPWLDHRAFTAGVRSFPANLDFMLTAYVVGVLVEGFSTLIAKSFHLTGRVASTSRRLRQNNRQMMAIFFPGGLRRDGDGWKLSTRVRFAHARIRSLLAKSDDWCHSAWGTPISAAHLGFAISVFSKRLLDCAVLVGARFSEEEKESVADIWRYAGYVMGIPEAILYTSRAEAERVYRIGYMCEPPPDADSVAMAHALIQAIPVVTDTTDPTEKEKMIGLAFRLSRALLGNHLANQLQYPRTSTVGTIFRYRMIQRFQRLLRREDLVRASNFSQLLQISVYDEEGLTYKMPDHVHTSKSSDW